MTMWNPFSKKPNTLSDYQDARVKALAKAGITFQKNDNLAFRLNAWNYANHLIGDDSKNIMKRAKWLDTAVKEIAMPWYRGLNNRSASDLAIGWEKLFAIHDLIYFVKLGENFDLKTATKKERWVYKSVAKKFKIGLFAWGYMIIDLSFDDKDISPAEVNVIQSNMPQQPSTSELEEIKNMFPDDDDEAKPEKKSYPAYINDNPDGENESATENQ